MAAVDDHAARDIEATALAYGMDVLIEVHDEDELERALKLKSRLVGINNRDLRTFKTSLAVSEVLAPKIPRSHVIVAESGLNKPADLARLKRIGISTFLIGESLMRNQMLRLRPVFCSRAKLVTQPWNNLMRKKKKSVVRRAKRKRGPANKGKNKEPLRVESREKHPRQRPSRRLRSHPHRPAR